MRFLLLVIVVAVPGWAQAPQPASPQTPVRHPSPGQPPVAASPQPAAGLAPAWDIRATLKALAAETSRLKPILEQVKPADWAAKGASGAYMQQLKASQNEMQYLIGSAEKLAARPEKLSVGLETLFRMEALERFLTSLAEGIRKYQNPALADLLQGVMTENSNNREKLRSYIVELATTQEQEFEIMDREAQRCRGFLSRQPAQRPSDRKTERK